jgi:dihydroorotase
MTFIIKNATLFVGNKKVVRDILIKDGKIKDISKTIFLKKVKVIDVKEKVVLPGLIDAHVHCRDPGATHKEDLKTAGLAAVAGGVTTIVDMPNNPTPTFSIKELKRKRKLAKKAPCNVLFHFGTNGKNLGEIRKAEQEEDVLSTKLYMNFTTGDYKISEKGILEGIFRTSNFLSLHAEGNELDTALELALKHKKRIYVCHNSSKKDILKIVEARKKFKHIYSEVCPHHLFLDQKDVVTHGALCCMKPSLKKESDTQFLWEALLDGTIDTIGTDHAPHTLQEKNKKNPPFGVPGLETMLPLLLDSVNKGKITLTQVVRLTSTNPASLFDLIGKGKIQKGYDADLVVVDMNKIKKVCGKELFTKCKWSPFENWSLKGWPTMTIVNGEVVWHD